MIINKENVYDLRCDKPSKLPCIRNYYHDKLASPIDSELILVINRNRELGSSGGVVLSANGEAVGLVVIRDGPKSIMVSVDGIKRFLDEHNKEVMAIYQLNEMSVKSKKVKIIKPLVHK